MMMITTKASPLLIPKLQPIGKVVTSGYSRPIIRKDPSTHTVRLRTQKSIVRMSIPNGPRWNVPPRPTVPPFDRTKPE